MKSSGKDLVSGGLRAMALGRIALGVGSLAAPGAMTRAFGGDDSPEVRYLTRVYGGRAIAMGLAWLMAGPGERTRLQRLYLGVDVSDTVAGTGHLVRGDHPAGAFAALTALTGAYAAIGAARLARDLRSA